MWKMNIQATVMNLKNTIKVVFRREPEVKCTDGQNTRQEQAMHYKYKICYTSVNLEN